MKIFKYLLVSLALMPFISYSQSNSRALQSKSQVECSMYPLFNRNDAAELWRRWRAQESFSQDDYGRVLDLCLIAYDYLNSDMDRIIRENASSDVRRRLALNLDMGLPSDMANFVRVFSNPMQNIAAQGMFDYDNLVKINEVIEKKNEFRHLNDLIFHG